MKLTETEIKKLERKLRIEYENDNNGKRLVKLLNIDIDNVCVEIDDTSRNCTEKDDVLAVLNFTLNGTELKLVFEYTDCEIINGKIERMTRLIYEDYGEVDFDEAMQKHYQILYYYINTSHIINFIHEKYACLIDEKLDEHIHKHYIVAEDGWHIQKRVVSEL